MGLGTEFHVLLRLDELRGHTQTTAGLGDTGLRGLLRAPQALPLEKPFQVT